VSEIPGAGLPKDRRGAPLGGPFPAKEKSLKRTVQIACAVAVILALSACVAGSAESQHAAASGVWQQLLLGFWHGLIAPVTLIVEVINRFAPHALPWTLHLYESRGAGVAYDVGFYFGLAGGPSFVGHRWSRRG
jgi:hypothetical protein